MTIALPNRADMMKITVRTATNAVRTLEMIDALGITIPKPIRDASKDWEKLRERARAARTAKPYRATIDDLAADNWTELLDRELHDRTILAERSAIASRIVTEATREYALAIEDEIPNLFPELVKLYQANHNRIVGTINADTMTGKEVREAQELRRTFVTTMRTYWESLGDALGDRFQPGNAASWNYFHEWDEAAIHKLRARTTTDSTGIHWYSAGDRLEIAEACGATPSLADSHTTAQKRAKQFDKVYGPDGAIRYAPQSNEVWAEALD